MPKSKNTKSNPSNALQKMRELGFDPMESAVNLAQGKGDSMAFHPAYQHIMNYLTPALEFTCTGSMYNISSKWLDGLVSILREHLKGQGVDAAVQDHYLKLLLNKAYGDADKTSIGETPINKETTSSRSLKRIQGLIQPQVTDS